MTFRPDDPQLSAWLLGELSAEQAAAVERAVAADAALQMAVRELESVQKLLTNSLSPRSSELFPRQRSRILQEARRLDAARKPVVEFPVRARKTPVSWFFPIATAAVLALACWLLIQLPSDPEQPLASGPEKPGTSESPSAPPAHWPSPAPGESTPAQPASAPAESLEFGLKLPKLLPRRAVAAAEAPVLPLPVQAGSLSLSWVTRAIRDEHRLPPASAVRFEEIINRFPLRPTGPVSVSQGVTLTAESLACPWRPSSRLLLVSLRGAAADASEVAAAFRPHAASVREYRLLGYARVEGALEVELPKSLPAAALHTLVIEIQPDSSASTLGAIEWTVNGKPAADLPLPFIRDAEPSDDARFAALAACFSQWLTDGASPNDRDILLGMVRELRAPGLPADREDFLRLVEEASALAK